MQLDATINRPRRGAGKVGTVASSDGALNEAAGRPLAAPLAAGPVAGSKAARSGGTKGATWLEASLPEPIVRAVKEASPAPLHLPSVAAFHALLIAPLVVWFIAILAGIATYEGLPPGTKRKWHIMIWFDRGVLRPAGSIVPFAVLAVRSVVLLIIGAWAQRKGHQDTAQRRTAPALATLMPLCARVYLGIMVLRGVVYLTHYAFMAVGLLPFHLVSDHIFLGATMATCLHAELVCVLVDVVRSLHPEHVSVRELLLTLVWLMALFLYLCTCADMFFTAKYFHLQVESATTLVAGFALFQLPVVRWLLKEYKAAASMVEPERVE